MADLNNLMADADGSAIEWQQALKFKTGFNKEKGL